MNLHHASLLLALSISINACSNYPEYCDSNCERINVIYRHKSLPESAVQVRHDYHSFQGERQYIRFKSDPETARKFSESLIDGKLSNDLSKVDMDFQRAYVNNRTFTGIDWWITSFDAEMSGGRRSEASIGQVNVILKKEGDDATVWIYARER